MIVSANGVLVRTQGPMLAVPEGRSCMLRSCSPRVFDEGVERIGTSLRLLRRLVLSASPDDLQVLGACEGGGIGGGVIEAQVRIRLD